MLILSPKVKLSLTIICFLISSLGIFINFLFIYQALSAIFISNSYNFIYYYFALSLLSIICWFLSCKILYAWFFALKISKKFLLISNIIIIITIVAFHFFSLLVSPLIFLHFYASYEIAKKYHYIK